MRGDYWVLELGADYEYALVGNPSRNSLFILARDKQIDQALFDELLDLAANKHGYGDAIDNVVKTVQD